MLHRHVDHIPERSAAHRISPDPSYTQETAVLASLEQSLDVHCMSAHMSTVENEKGSTAITKIMGSADEWKIIRVPKSLTDF